MAQPRLKKIAVALSLLFALAFALYVGLEVSHGHHHNEDGFEQSCAVCQQLQKTRETLAGGALRARAIVGPLASLAAFLALGLCAMAILTEATPVTLKVKLSN